MQRYFEAILLMAVFYRTFKLLADSPEYLSLLNHPYFILTIGLAGYFLGTAMLFLFTQRFIESGITNYWMLHGVFNILLNFCYTYVLWRGKKVSMYL